MGKVNNANRDTSVNMIKIAYTIMQWLKDSVLNG